MPNCRNKVLNEVLLQALDLLWPTQRDLEQWTRHFQQRMAQFHLRFQRQLMQRALQLQMELLELGLISDEC